MRFVWITITALLLLTSSGAGAESAVASQAADLLRRTAETLGAAPQYSVRAEVTIDEVASTGQKIERGGVVDIRVRRPDRLSLDHDGDRFRRRFVYDGEKLTIVDVRQNLYGSFDAPSTIDELITLARENYGVVFPLGEILVAKPAERLVPNIEAGFHLGASRVDGVECQHLAFTQASVDWQVWIEDGPTPLLRKLVVTYKSLPQSPQFTARFANWDLESPLADDAFVARLPDGASKIDFEPMEAAP